MNRFFIGCMLALATLTLAAQVVYAHGEEKHEKDDTMSAHMQAMYALKETIPEEYRIMDRTPVTPDEASLARGRELYRQQCAVCHGEDGRGDGPAAGGLATPPADFLDREHSGIYGPGEKYWIVGHGSGETGMPAFPQIEPLDRWHLVNHIYSLQKSGPDRTKTKHDH